MSVDDESYKQCKRGCQISLFISVTSFILYGWFRNTCRTLSFHVQVFSFSQQLKHNEFVPEKICYYKLYIFGIWYVSRLYHISSNGTAVYFWKDPLGVGGGGGGHYIKG